MPHAEERRLFYVAMTRCKKKLFFIVDQTRPSRFMYELHSKILPESFSEESNFLRNARIAAKPKLAAQSQRSEPLILRVHRLPKLPLHPTSKISVAYVM